MNFLKMSDKSLFAVLLRSPWWVSLLIVLGFSLLARALLPPKYVMVAVLGTFPFVVTGVMSARRQWREPSAAQLTEALARVAAMSWREFAAAIEQAMVAQGYEVTRLDGEGEAADFRLERLGQVSLLSARRWKAANQGVEALRQLEVACRRQGVQQGIYVSLGPVSDAAERHAQGAGIRLVHELELARLMRGEEPAVPGWRKFLSAGGK
jgi:restriction system protein